VIGRAIDVDGRRLQIVGVMARGSDLMDSHPEIWLPLGFTDGERRARNNHNLYLIGRLKKSVTLASAQVELNAYQMLLEGLRNVPGVRAATGMTGLPLESPLSSYQTEIANNTRTSGSVIPSINYYQRVMSGFF
jgi:hypothetical protein